MPIASNSCKCCPIRLKYVSFIDLHAACSVNVEGTISVYAVGESVLSEDPCMEW